jgi:hypothetical protein
MDVRSVREKYIKRHSSFLNVQKLAKLADVAWGQKMSSVRQNFEPFPTVDILNMRGVPPLMGSPKGPNTKSALIKIIVELLKDLPPASNILEAEEQVKTTLRFVYQAGVQSRVMNHINELGNEFVQNAGSVFTLEGALAHCEKIEATAREIPYFGYDAPFIQPLTLLTDTKDKEIFLAKSYVSHGLIIGRNGAVQIILIPSTEKLIQMLESDDTAKKHILKTQPLSDKSCAITFQDKPDLLIRLRTQSEFWISYDNDSMTNFIFRNSPFDLPRHIRAGRLKVVLDKVGADGLNLWQNTHDDFYRALKSLNKNEKPKNQQVV